MKVKNARTVAIEIHPAVHHAMNVVDRVWWKLIGQHPRCTGLGEEGHSTSSKHYGELGDIRCRAFDVDADEDSLPPELADRVLEEIRSRLPSTEFDVLLEGAGTVNAHVHIELDPKEVTP